MQFQVNRVLFRGKIQEKSPPLQSGFTEKNNKIGFGAISGQLPGYCCPRCRKSFGFFFSEPTGVMFFCGTDSCLKEDALFTKPTGTKKTFVDHKNLPELGTRYSTACLTNWIADENNKVRIKDWYVSPKDFLVVAGGPNTGKTHLCAALAYHFMERHYDFNENDRIMNRTYEWRYISAVRFIDELHKSIASGIGQYEAIKKFSNLELLILDDLGSSSNNDWQKEVFFDLIDQRYSNHRPTIITSNFDYKTMCHFLGERISRRVFASENTTIFLGAINEQ